MGHESLSNPGSSEIALSELRERTERLLLAMDAACIGTWAWDLRTNQVTWDERMHRLFGLQPGSFSGDFDAFLRMVHPDDHEGLEKTVRTAVGGTEHYEATFRGVWSDHTLRHLEARGRVSRDETGQPLRINGVCWDITAQKQAEMRLDEVRHFFDSIVEHLPVGIFVKKAEDLRFVFFNKANEEITGFTKAEVLGKNDHDLFPAEEAGAFTAADREVLSQGRLADVSEEIIHTKDHGVRFLHTRKIRLTDQSGEPSYLLGISEDITERKLAQEALQKAREQLERRVEERTAQLRAANAILKEEISERKRAAHELREKAEELARSNRELEHFAYVASHDLQEPLRMVASYMQLLERRYKGRLDQDADDFIKFAVDGASRMKELINDLLEYSRVGTRGGEFIVVDCNEVFDRVVRSIQLSIERAGAEVTRDHLPTIVADDQQLSQLFQNLLSNSVKFHGPTKPVVRVGATDRGAEWEFQVKDNGIGIEPQFSDRIFEIFQRLHTRDEYEGTGIGLAICRRVVERHGGRIWVESVPGQGAKFSFTIPKRNGNKAT
jgi:PAS domain S-box-containing protein